VTWPLAIRPRADLFVLFDRCTVLAADRAVSFGDAAQIGERRGASASPHRARAAAARSSAPPSPRRGRADEPRRLRLRVVGRVERFPVQRDIVLDQARVSIGTAGEPREVDMIRSRSPAAHASDTPAASDSTAARTSSCARAAAALAASAAEASSALS
jgi:hypothetical protein